MMEWLLLLQNFVLLFVLVTSIIAVLLRDLMYAVFVLAGGTVAMSVLFVLLKAPDVAITNAAVYGAMATILYVVAISKTERMEGD
jgi:uncharacterized MnhB-related membrane protein